MGVYVHSGLRILQCRHCRAYLATLDLNGHMVAHGLSIDRALIDKATLLCRELRLYESQTDVPFPTPLGPPIQHLSSVPGYLCRQAGCGYAVVNHEGMTKHEQKKHGLASLHRDLHTRSRFALQVLFPRRRTYTAVDLDLPASSKPDVIKYIIQEFLPVATAPPPITTATDDRGRAPLERAMQWDDLLLDIRQDRQALQNLVALRAKPTESDEGIFLRLAESVKAWCLHIHAAMKAHPARNDLERVIMYGKAPWPASGYVFLFHPSFAHFANAAASPQRQTLETSLRYQQCVLCRVRTAAALCRAPAPWPPILASTAPHHRATYSV